jgi:hypothetical protein
MDSDPQHWLPVQFFVTILSIMKSAFLNKFVFIQTGWREKLKSYPEIMADMFEAMTRQANQQLFSLFTLPYWRKIDQLLFRFSTF